MFEVKIEGRAIFSILNFTNCKRRHLLKYFEDVDFNLTMMRHWFNLLHAGCRTATSVTRAQRSLLNPSEVTTTQRGFAVFKGNLSASNDTETPAKGDKAENETFKSIS